jgi:SAM-dependent methyltransferase
MKINVNRTRDVASDWKISKYYDHAEQQDWTDVFWRPETHFRRLFETLNRRVLVDLACGHGRHSARILGDISLKAAVQSLYLLDINKENVKFCRKRFANESIVRAYKNNGYDFNPIGRNEITGIFCYDAMVHFELDAVASYLRDAYRVLAPGGRALFHHSNNESSPGADYRDAKQWRNFMSKNLFAHLAIRSGFKVLEQVPLNWENVGGPDESLDCITLIERLDKPAWTPLSTRKRVMRKLSRLLRRT